MIDGIRHNLNLIEPGARKSTKADSSKSAAMSDAYGLSSSIGAETVEISASAVNIGGAPVDRARVDAIRSAIRNNAYPVDFELLAKRMVESMSEEPA